jgi:hypothetical protein
VGAPHRYLHQSSGSPNGLPSYASSVLAMAGSVAPAPAPPTLDPSSFDLSSLDPAAPLADVGSSDYLIPAAIVGGLALIWWLLD